jgi:hypothetical protein
MKCYWIYHDIFPVETEINKKRIGFLDVLDGVMYVEIQFNCSSKELSMKHQYSNNNIH